MALPLRLGARLGVTRSLQRVTSDGSMERELPLDEFLRRRHKK